MRKYSPNKQVRFCFLFAFLVIFAEAFGTGCQCGNPNVTYNFCPLNSNDKTLHCAHLPYMPAPLCSSDRYYQARLLEAQKSLSNSYYKLFYSSVGIAAVWLVVFSCQSNPATRGPAVDVLGGAAVLCSFAHFLRSCYFCTKNWIILKIFRSFLDERTHVLLSQQQTF